MDVIHFTVEPNASVECNVRQHYVFVTIEVRPILGLKPMSLFLTMTHQQAIAAGVVSQETVDAEVAKLSENEGMTGADRLRAHLAHIPPGQISDTTDLERLLAACWDEFTGDYGDMAAYKLLGRMEDVTWEPPVLNFTVERHGATVAGSTRANLQGWTVNIEQNTIFCEPLGCRQVRPMQARLKVEPLVEEIVRLIVAKQEDDRLQWHDDCSVKVLVGNIFPADSAVKQTLAGRRKRFRKALVERLGAEGWGLTEHPYTFSR
jgi:hypothetical protein